MTIPDLINGSFELLAGLFVSLSIRKLHREKIVRGVSWVHIGYFTAWGMWNIYYYPHLGQIFSFYGGIVVAAANLAYTVMLVWYSLRNSDKAYKYDS